MEVYKQEIFNPIYQVFNENQLIVNDNETDEKKKNTCEVFTSFFENMELSIPINNEIYTYTDNDLCTIDNDSSIKNNFKDVYYLI